MTTEERLAMLEKDVAKLKDQSKDGWDKLAIVCAALIPVTIAAVGGAYTYFSQRADKSIAATQAAENSRLRQGELLSMFLGALTGDDEQDRQLAVDALLVAAPEYGPVLVRATATLAPTPVAVTYANNALDNRRDLLIRQMFAENSEQRTTAYTQLIASWDNDESLIPAVIAYGLENKSNENGIYNSLVLLSHMERDTIRKRSKEITDFANAVEGNGARTKQRADVLRSRLAG